MQTDIGNSQNKPEEKNIKIDSYHNDKAVFYFCISKIYHFEW